jgi:hypothetical protein
VVAQKGAPIKSSFFGLKKRGPCPVCGELIEVNLGFSRMLMCQSCGFYLQVIEKELRQMDPTLVSPQPAFAAPTPWADMQAPRSGALPLRTCHEITSSDAVFFRGKSV